MPNPVWVNGSTGMTGTGGFFVGPAGTNITAWHIGNPTTGAGYIQFYDQNTAPTVGTTVPKLSIFVPTATSQGLAFAIPGGVYFATGCWVAATTGALTGAPGTPLHVNLILA